MEKGLLGLCYFWTLGLILHFLKIYLERVLLKRKEKYQDFLKSEESKIKLEYNWKTYKINNFEMYVRSLGYGKWFCIFFGILALTKELFAEYF